MNSQNASNFKANSLEKSTRLRVKLIMKYIIHCYLMMVKEGKTYSFSEKGKLKKEDFLRNGLVNDYLSQKPNKDYFKNHISDEPKFEIFFQKEELQEYEIGGVKQEDFIDISVKDSILSSLSGEISNDEIRLAVECKRVKNNNDYLEYTKDIQKFADRPYTTFRLPYEAQIAFIENEQLNPAIVSKEICLILEKSQSIQTTQNLIPIKIHDNFEASYHSSHKRNHSENIEFSITHLFFNYFEVVV
ncbi:MAG: hypothetical protein EAZ53_09255 [Bacteroidetes bacterium]|nr:MAG: hypothetical protein EAZ53_09255 [Bacteroidota bacterium]